MVPRHDLANHDVSANVEFKLLEQGGELVHALVALRCINTGDELLLGYGQEKSNDVLLASYGFVVPGNINDRLTMGRVGRWSAFGDLVRDCAALDARMWSCLQSLGLHVWSSGVCLLYSCAALLAVINIHLCCMLFVVHFKSHAVQ